MTRIIWYYNKHAQWKFLWKLLPWMIIGVLLGVYVGKDLPEGLFKQGMAIIILITVGMMIWWDLQKTPKIPKNPIIAPFTVATGFIASWICQHLKPQKISVIFVTL